MKRSKMLAWMLLVVMLVGCMAFPAGAEADGESFSRKKPTVVGQEVTLGENVIITFGTYEQDNNPENGPEPIEWLVLSFANGSRVLVVSRFALEYMPHHNHTDADGNFEMDYTVTWETCDLRAWLNGEFLQTAFTEAELEKIPTVTVNAKDDNSDKDMLGGWWGNDTQDRAFVLSMSEAESYFPEEDLRKCQATAYATANAEARLGRPIDIGTGYTQSDMENCWWWLRTPGEFYGSAMCISPSGYVSWRAYKDLSKYQNDNLRIAVRPAIWIELDK